MATTKTTNEVVEKKTTARTTKRNINTIKKELREKARDIEVEIENLSGADVILKDKRYGDTLNLVELGDRTVIPLSSFINFRNQGRKIFEGLSLVLVDVFSSEYSVDDVLKLVNLDKIYEIDNLCVETMDNFILEKDAGELERDFEKLKSNQLKYRLAERSVDLYRENRLDSGMKRTMFERYTNNDYLYSNVL